jgi:hypothetical protein
MCQCLASPRHDSRDGVEVFDFTSKKSPGKFLPVGKQIWWLCNGFYQIWLLLGGSMSQRSRVRESKIDITRRGGGFLEPHSRTSTNRSPKLLDQRNVFDFTGMFLSFENID